MYGFLFSLCSYLFRSHFVTSAAVSHTAACHLLTADPAEVGDVMWGGSGDSVYYARLLDRADQDQGVAQLERLAEQYAGTVRMLAAADPAVDSSCINEQSVSCGSC